MDDNQRHHLQMIQDIITRMNTNSFQIKTMSITIVSALLALYSAILNPIILLLAAIPIIIFWALDSYYLQQERKFRGLYNDIISDRTTNISLFSMPIGKYKDGEFSFFTVVKSDTQYCFYLPFLSLVIVVWAFIKYPI